MKPSLSVLLVDPSLFTAPYDAALTGGLLAVGVSPIWAVRPTREGDRQELGDQYVDDFFYRYSDRLGLPKPVRAAMKGLSHGLGLSRLVLRVVRHKPDIVHFQWTLLPPLDSLAIAVIRLLAPVVLTVHDTTPFNGEHVSFLQNAGFDLPAKLSDAVIVHTEAGRRALIERGVAREKIAVVAHGPLKLHAAPSADSQGRRSDGRWTFVLFGEMKPYKGLDVLVEALGMLPLALRAQARVVAAGRPRMDLSRVRARITELGLDGTIEIRAKRLSEQEMADLFAESDCFVFPYRQIDASGVYFLVKAFSKWSIASNVGVFAEDLGQEPTRGVLVPPADVAALAAAIESALMLRPKPEPQPADSSWSAIGARTLELYRAALSKRRSAARVPLAAEDISP